MIEQKDKSHICKTHECRDNSRYKIQTALRAREVQSTERDSVKVTVQLVSKIKGQED